MYIYTVYINTVYKSHVNTIFVVVFIFFACNTALNTHAMQFERDSCEKIA